MEKKAYKITNKEGCFTQFFRIDKENDKVEVVTEKNGKCIPLTFKLTFEQYERGLLKWKRDGYTIEDVTKNYF